MDISKFINDLQKAGKVSKLKNVVDSADGKRLSELVDSVEVERAAQTGDVAAMQEMLKRVMSTEEGRRMAKQISDMMK